MPPKSTSDLKAEIGHVLFLDIVGYSRLLIDQQSERLQQLKEIVRHAREVQSATKEDGLLRLPTGDGMALVFRQNIDQAAECALEISAALWQHPELPLRMGIHSGPINSVLDVNDRANVAGAGIDVAQRVMDCGDAGHILLSKRAADDLSPYPRWNPHLHDLGEIEVKHGARVHLVNLFTDDAGNPATPSSIRKTREPLVMATAPKLNSRAFLLVTALALLSLGGGFWWFVNRSAHSASSPGVTPVPVLVPAKSIAVLPFQNLSAEQSNAYFADGIQDEILTNLSKIGDLKVISRTSVMQYKSGAERNLREIGKQLGVANLLEGSVQRDQGKVRVIAQLIDTRTDAHVWAHTYDRDLADVFAIQSDIASAIAEQLQAKLAPEEKARLARQPTANSEAYLLYLQANEVLRSAAAREDAVQADKLYVQAIALDPSFVLARARASILNSLMYSIGRDPLRKERARTLAEEALARGPNLGEAHLALGLYFYRIDRDYKRALTELAMAGAASPNDSEILDATGFIYRREGRFADALAAFAEARERDPRRAHFDGKADTLRVLRKWPESSAAYGRGLQLEPQSVVGWTGLAYAQFAQSGSPVASRATLARLQEELKKKPAMEEATWNYAMLARDFAAAEKLIPTRPVEEFPAFEPAPWFQGCLALVQGDRDRALGLLEEIKPMHESGANDHPDDPIFHAALGKLYALLGQKEDAIREAQRAVELCPENQDALAGADFAANLAFVYAQTNEPEKAITLLTRLLTLPGAERITLAHLRMSWEWDPLRKDPRFQKLVEGPEPVTVFH